MTIKMVQRMNTFNLNEEINEIIEYINKVDVVNKAENEFISEGTVESSETEKDLGGFLPKVNKSNSLTTCKSLSELKLDESNSGVNIQEKEIYHEEVEVLPQLSENNGLTVGGKVETTDTGGRFLGDIDDLDLNQEHKQCQLSRKRSRRKKSTHPSKWSKKIRNSAKLRSKSAAYKNNKQQQPHLDERQSEIMINCKPIKAIVRETTDKSASNKSVHHSNKSAPLISSVKTNSLVSAIHAYGKLPTTSIKLQVKNVPAVVEKCSVFKPGRIKQILHNAYNSSKLQSPVVKTGTTPMATLTSPLLLKLVNSDILNGPHSSVKVYMSDKQSGVINVCGMDHPCAPPSTPTPFISKKYEYIPSMTDVKAQRSLKAKLENIEKQEKKKFHKQKEEKLKLESTQAKELSRQQRLRQRQEIYALNKVMTILENEHFEKFISEHGFNV
ncbi:uncharacterized protein LOC141902382 [Tubulanus polymorphus]|uniref:uncharacterized protein LOC141902382 n=1 Tax=Tubulanus polymorphus TaxID=672921 RepID=UPI003DA36DEF